MDSHELWKRYRNGLYDRRFALCEIELAAVASRTGRRAAAYRDAAQDHIGDFKSFAGPDSVRQLLDVDIDFACVATAFGTTPTRIRSPSMEISIFSTNINGSASITSAARNWCKRPGELALLFPSVPRCPGFRSFGSAMRARGGRTFTA